MKLRNEMAQVRQRGVPASKSQSPQTNFQLEGVWLYVARGVWIAFVLTELLVLISTLVATRGHGLTICPFPANCAVTQATAQALYLLRTNDAHLSCGVNLQRRHLGGFSPLHGWGKEGRRTFS